MRFLLPNIQRTIAPVCVQGKSYSGGRRVLRFPFSLEKGDQLVQQIALPLKLFFNSIQPTFEIAGDGGSCAGDVVLVR